MRRLRTLVDHPHEVNFFLFLGGFALVIGVIYWFVSHEAAGTVLLLGFAVATGAVGLRLAVDPAAARARRLARDQPAPDPGAGLEQVDPGGRGSGAEGTGGVDRPFLDEAGRLPTETFAPFAVGLGTAVASTGLIFGIAPVIVGVLPFLWGCWAWLTGARAELEATQADSDALEAESAALAASEDGRPVEATPGRAAGR
ncbi:MAG TPA: hypothetical protein VM344_05800 [Vitreimonas sp.]|nr:hypothetical protein [Vitreimonas sp.]